MSHFNQVANSWDTLEKIKINQLYADGIKKYLTKKDSIKILEVGCGTGLLGSQFLHETNQLTGVDTSTGMLEVFNQKFHENKNVHSRLLNLEEQELDEDGFDLIISSMAFHHLKEPGKMVVKLKKMLSPGGILAIIDLDAEDGSFHPDPKNMGVHHFGFAEETIQAWSSAAQFKKLSREIINVIKKEQGEYPIFLAVFFN
jgi:ubiquinone/menaquinone biosynthesis C-methylase UbiE